MQINSETVVNLTMAQLIAVVTGLVAIVSLLIVGARHVERNLIRLDRSETNIADLTRTLHALQELMLKQSAEISALTHQVQTLMGLLANKSRITKPKSVL